MIPGLVYFNFAEQTKKSEEGVWLINKTIFGSALNENILFKQLPLLISSSREFQEITCKKKSSDEPKDQLSQRDAVKKIITSDERF